MHLFDRAGEVNGFLLYKVDLFSPARISAIARQFCALAAEAIADPSARLSGLTVAET